MRIRISKHPKAHSDDFGGDCGRLPEVCILNANQCIEVVDWARVMNCAAKLLRCHPLWFERGVSNEDD